MKIWVDAQLSPVIAQWLRSTYGVEAVAVRDLRLRDAQDRNIFLSARETKAVILTKDRDLPDLVIRHGALPQILWITCGNTSNAKRKTIFAKAWPVAESLLNAGETIVEISDHTGEGIRLPKPFEAYRSTPWSNGSKAAASHQAPRSSS